MTDKTSVTETRIAIEGVRNDNDVRKCLQKLYGIFADTGMGQATFEMTGEATADVVIKHSQSVTVDPEVIDAAVRKAGPYRLA